MRFSDQVNISIWAIKANKMRSFAIVAALAAGIGAVVMVTSIIIGFGKQIENLSFGVYSRSLVIQANFLSFEGFSPPKLADLKRLEDGLESVDFSVAWRSEEAQIYVDGKYSKIRIFGAWGNYTAETGSELLSGRHLELEETQSAKRICLLSSDIKDSLFVKENAIGKNIRINGVSCEVIGVLAEPAVRSAERFSSGVVMPFNSAARYFSDGNFLGPNEASRLTIVLTDKRNLYDETIKADLLLRKSRGVPLSQPSPFRYEDPASSTRSLKRQNALLAKLLIGLASISLIAGLIGFSSVMASSIVERRREIALQMTIGAYPTDIMLQVIIQSVILGFLGGVFGIVFGVALSYGATAWMGWPFAITSKVVFYAVGIGILSGIMAGLLPAKRASEAPPALAARI